MPAYQLSIPEVWADWTWSERFPPREELCRYFDHVDKVLNVKKDVLFSTRVVSAQYFPHASVWRIGTENGHVVTSRFYCWLPVSARSLIRQIFKAQKSSRAQSTILRPGRALASTGPVRRWQSSVREPQAYKWSKKCPGRHPT
ncbi:hypothetical protein IWW34DRAFT_773148 [Fusarium oxysporum f. sp. albedinis]|nr:hypothetical protein IWW34DRAFT_773148 [Fusarium oxysporum f. sp. albedinis]